MKPINYQIFRAGLEYKRNLLGYNKKELAEKIGMNKNTFCRKCIRPQLFTLPELIHLMEGLELKNLYDLFKERY